MAEPHPNPPPYSATANPITTQPAFVVYPGQTTVVIVENPMGYEPCIYPCKSCNLRLTTRVERKPACRTHLCAGALCLFGFWPCVCLPYCVNACNDADHYCSNCGSYIGSYRG
ncbi:lipopolysaccharide-induced tumor necrosis factor-alpha factor homolog [Aricia agestis]|uniref:lipopolysaccharide-induced tumor necrosis factor-alpha factor homolog n=1 Tax=Aricia agestis TaxID=91739 RepID=UPI001C2028D3|nr:lipopolysaccharide-induced tumor necrosis factor-alpha factor homolog [Aricia agestis]